MTGDDSLEELKSVLDVMEEQTRKSIRSVPLPPEGRLVFVKCLRCYNYFTPRELVYWCFCETCATEIKTARYGRCP